MDPANINTMNPIEKLEEMQNELRCSVCQDYFMQACTLSCSHSFCLVCINNWRQTHTDCPMCRQNITGMAPSRALDNMVATLGINRSISEQNTQQFNFNNDFQQSFPMRFEIRVSDDSSNSSDHSWEQFEEMSSTHSSSGDTYSGLEETAEDSEEDEQIYEGEQVQEDVEGEYDHEEYVAESIFGDVDQGEEGMFDDDDSNDNCDDIDDNFEDFIDGQHDDVVLFDNLHENDNHNFYNHDVEDNAIIDIGIQVGNGDDDCDDDYDNNYFELSDGSISYTDTYYDDY